LSLSLNYRRENHAEKVVERNTEQRVNSSIGMRGGRGGRGKRGVGCKVCTECVDKDEKIHPVEPSPVPADSRTRVPSGEGSAWHTGRV